MRAGQIEAARATATIEMCKLNGAIVQNPADGTFSERTSSNWSDRRVHYRTDAWNRALIASENLKTVYMEYPSKNSSAHIREEMEALVTATSISTGFWSVWMTVFHNELVDWHNTMNWPDSLDWFDDSEQIKLLDRLFVTSPPTLGKMNLFFRGNEVDRIII